MIARGLPCPLCVLAPQRLEHIGKKRDAFPLTIQIHLVIVTNESYLVPKTSNTSLYKNNHLIILLLPNIEIFKASF